MSVDSHSNTDPRKRVLIVQSSSALDGSAHSGLLLADGLREAGWTVHVAFGGEGPIIERYEASGHTTHVVPHKNWLRRGGTPQFAKDVWLEWRKARAFERLIEEVRPDVVYLNTVVSLAGAVAARRKDVSSVWHLREMFSDIGGEMHAPRWAVPLVRRVIREHADQLAANSSATAQNLLGNLADEATVIPNAVRTAFFEEGRSQEEARSEFDLVTGIPIIGVPGTLRPMKGHPFFFEAVAPLLRKRNELRVAVTGEGAVDFSARLRKQVRQLDIQDQVSFLGWVEDMPAFYRACDLICIPSRAEPFGRTAIEAFAVGTPVVAAAVGGLQEVVTSGETGVLIPYGDNSRLREGLSFMLRSTASCREMVANARMEAENKYRDTVYKDEVLNVLKNV